MGIKLFYVSSVCNLGTPLLGSETASLFLWTSLVNVFSDD